jgi:ATP phosphoribosyltransferase regulatory subunit
MRNWLLPEYIEDILPAEALRVEGLRWQLLELFRVHGYQVVIPPLLEYVESLLTGTGHDMDIRTFKLVDQLSGRLMGVRADITPQVARIDAHLLNRQGVARLCYAASVLHTLPTGIAGSREPLQVGAEIYGHPGLESDIEIQQLMLKALKLAGVGNVHLNVGHVAIFRSLIQEARIGAETEAELFRALQAKDVAALKELTLSLPTVVREALLLLPEMYGDAEMLDVAMKKLPDHPAIRQALADLRSLAERLAGSVSSLCFDLSDLRGYHYHSGIVFAAYAQGWADAVALGGRYDEVGLAFGRARPATGFSLDLREISAALPAAELPKGILAPFSGADSLREKVDALRTQGEVVVVELPGHQANRADLNCDRMLVEKNGVWEIAKI